MNLHGFLIGSREGAIEFGGSAAMLGLQDRGTIQQGKKADFLVLDANPLDDIRNTRELVSIWHGGKEIKPRARTVATK